jgi:prevent-host-death family protein
MNVTQARQEFSQLLNRVYRKESRIVVEKSGIPVAAIVSAQDLEEFRRWEEQRRKDFWALDKLSEAFRDVPEEELEREIAKALSEARAKAQTERMREESTTRNTT